MCLTLINTSITWWHGSACASLSAWFKWWHNFFNPIADSSSHGAWWFQVLPLWTYEIRLWSLSCHQIIGFAGRSLIANLRTLSCWRRNVEFLKIGARSLKVRIILKLSKGSCSCTRSIINRLIMRRLKALAYALRRVDSSFGFQIWVKVVSSDRFIRKSSCLWSWRFTLLLMILSSWS